MVEKEVQNQVSDVIQSALEESFEADDNDWSVYDDFKNNLKDKLLKVIEKLLEENNSSPPKASKGRKKKEKYGGVEVVRNPYAKWVSGISKIRKGEHDGNDEIEVGCYFKNTSSTSAQKYLNIKDNIGIDGTKMTVKELIYALKDAFPTEKDMTVNAISWGLVDEGRRKDIALHSF